MEHKSTGHNRMKYKRKARGMRPNRGVESVECRKQGKSIEYKAIGTQIEPMRMEYMSMERMRMWHIMIRLKAVGKQKKSKRLCKTIKHIRMGRMVEFLRMTCDSIELESAE